MPAPIISVDQMRKWEDATWATGQSVETVMRLAGRAVAEAAMRLTPAGASIVVLAGKGNNGGDAKYATEYIEDRKVHLVEIHDPASGIHSLPQRLELTRNQGDLLIDGLFGIGLNRDLAGDWKQIIHAINEFPTPVLAVDVPSGLNADSGDVMGAAIKAQHTITFGAPKNGLIRTRAAECTGHLLLAAEIGLTDSPESSGMVWTEGLDFDHYPTPRPASGHKGTFGHLAVIAGSEGYHGAAVLAARGALRAMPGLVSVYTPAYAPVAAQLQQAMVRPAKDELKFPDSTSAILIGPGLAGPEVSKKLRRFAQALWSYSALPVVVDASALDWLPDELESTAPRVITPHPGEAARLLDKPAAFVQDDRPDALRRLSTKFGNCWVVLKGHQTLIGRAEDTISVNSSGNALLGQGGSGDVLAGFLAGHIAQPLLRKDVGRLIRFAVWEHGASADVLSQYKLAWEVDELISVLGNSRITPNV